MNCQDIARLLDEEEVDDLLAGQPDVQAHLATCPACNRDWQIHAQLVSARIPAVPAGLRAHFQAPVARGSGTGARSRKPFVVIGGIVAMAAAAGMLTLKMNGSPAPAAATADPVQVDRSMTEVYTKALPSPAESMPTAESKPVGEQQSLEEWTGRTREWLAVRDDPDALIAAALMMLPPPNDAPGIQLLLRRATELAPDSARIHATAMLLCLALNPCDATPYEQSLRRLAPDNALGWAREVSRASRAEDKEALRRALADMSRAKTFDLYWNTSTLSIAAQIVAARVAPPDSGRESPAMLAIGVFAAMPIPAFRPIIDSCKSATDAATLLACRQIGAAMRAGDTVLVNTLGLNVSGSGLPADSAEALALERERKQIRWISMNQPVAQPGDDAADFLRMLADHPREIDAWRALLKERGISTEPPADWKP